jgi:hypothetical protein
MTKDKFIASGVQLQEKFSELAREESIRNIRFITKWRILVVISLHVVVRLGAVVTGYLSDIEKASIAV